MKFKFNPEKSNKLLMSSIIFLSFVTCLFWIILREYIYFIVYFSLTLFIAITYFCTRYYIKDNYLIIKLGFISIKISYLRINNVENLNDKVKLNLIKYSLNIYPQNKDIFVAKLNSKLTNKNSYNIIDKK